MEHVKKILILVLCFFPCCGYAIDFTANTKKEVQITKQALENKKDALTKKYLKLKKELEDAMFSMSDEDSKVCVGA